MTDAQVRDATRDATIRARVDGLIAAMTLAGGEYAIHGTNRPNSIGTYASYGCIRMYNQDITDLYERVSVGTQVYVTR